MLSNGVLHTHRSPSRHQLMSWPADISDFPDRNAAAEIVIVLPSSPESAVQKPHLRTFKEYYRHYLEARKLRWRDTLLASFIALSLCELWLLLLDHIF
jgi:hypothetical protein